MKNTLMDPDYLLICKQANDIHFYINIQSDTSGSKEGSFC